MFDAEKHQDEVNRLINVGQYADAIPLLEALIDYFFEAQDWEKHAEYLNRYSECLWRFGNFKKSVSVAEQALEICHKHLKEGHIEVANSYNHLGICYADIGNYPLSIQYHQQSLAIKQALLGKFHPFVASSYNNLGLSYRVMDDLPQAIEYHYQALNIRQSVLGKKHILTARSFHNLGSCYNEMGEIEKGTAYLHQALTIKLKELGEQHPQTAITLQTLGVSYIRLHKYAEAVEVYQKVLKVKISFFGYQHTYTARTYFSLGYCYLLLGLHDEAMTAYNHAFVIWHQSFGEKNYNVAMVYAAYADVYAGKNDFAQAFHYFQKSLQSLNLPVSDTDIYPIPPLTDYNKSAQLLETLYGKSIALLKLYHHNQNLCDLTASLAHFLNADRVIDQKRQSYKSEDSKHILAERAKKMVYDAGLEALQTAQNECLRLGEEVVNDAIQFYNQQYNYGLPPTLNDLAFYFSEKSKSMLLYAAITDSKAKVNANLPVEVAEEEQQLRDKLTRMEQQINEESGDNNQQSNPSVPNQLLSEQFHLSKQYIALIERLEKEYPNYYHLKYDLKVADIGQIQAALPPKTALVSYVLSDEYLYTICITATRQHWQQQPLPVGFDYLADDFNYTFHPFEKETYLQYGHDLYRLLLQPLEENGCLNAIRRLVIIPDGKLSHIPFEALLTQPCSARQSYKDLPYLLQRYVISYHYSATLWLQQQKPLPEKYKTPKHIQSVKQNGHGVKGDFIGFAPVYSDNITPSDNHDIDLTIDIDIYKKLGLEKPQKQSRINMPIPKAC